VVTPASNISAHANRARGLVGCGTCRGDRGDPAIGDVDVLSLVDSALTGLRHHQHRNVANQQP
jgi:hypothetical protein